MKYLPLFLLFLLSTLHPAAATSVSAVSGLSTVDTRNPSVSNAVLAYDEDTGVLQVNYDLQSTNVTSAAVTMQISDDGGLTWTVPVATASGALGNVSPGAGLSIRWNPADDIRNGAGLRTFQVRLATLDTTVAAGSQNVDLDRPTNGIQYVRLCFDAPAPVCAETFFTFGKGWDHRACAGSMPPANPPIPGDDRTVIVAEWAKIFSRSILPYSAHPVLRQQSGDPGDPSKVINVYFCNAIDAKLGGFAKNSGTEYCPDRFNRFPGGEIVIFYDADKLNYLFNNPMSLSSTLAHEIGHCLGLSHIKDQPDCNDAIMDYNHCLNGNALPGSLSRVALPIEGIYGVYENELYHLLRWTFGLNHAALVNPSAPLLPLLPGNYDITDISAGACGSTSTMSLNLTGDTGQLIYDVQILHSGAGEVSTVISRYSSLTLAQLSALQFTLPSAGHFTVIGSSSAAGEQDMILARTDLNAADPERYSIPAGSSFPVALVKKLPAGDLVNVSTGTNSVQLTPVAPADLRVETAGGGANAVIRYTAMPGLCYQVERSDDLVSWNVLAPMVKAERSDGLVLDAAAASASSKRYYRVKVAYTP